MNLSYLFMLKKTVEIMFKRNFGRVIIPIENEPKVCRKNASFNRLHRNKGGHIHVTSSGQICNISPTYGFPFQNATFWGPRLCEVAIIWPDFIGFSDLNAGFAMNVTEMMVENTHRFKPMGWSCHPLRLKEPIGPWLHPLNHANC